jgi:hypothetical protein
MIDQLGKGFGQKHYRQYRDYEQERVPGYFTDPGASAARTFRGRFRLSSRRVGLDEKCSVTPSLDREKNPVQKNGI